MPEHAAILFCSFLIFTFGLFSKLSGRSLITAPMFFLLAGVLVSPVVLNLFDVEFEGEVMKLVAELTLIIILFVDASMIKYDCLLKTLAGIPARLLLIGLPLTMFMGP